MSLSKLESDLYQQVILEHNRKPKNYRKISEATHQAEGYNPLCGDHLWVYLQVSDAEVVDDVSFEGDGCAISKASASLMTTLIKGKTLADARIAIEQFRQLITGQIDPQAADKLGRLKIFSGVQHYPTRVKCAGLAWHTLENAAAHEHVVANTEQHDHEGSAS